MAQCRSNTKLKDSLRLRSGTSSVKNDSGCDPSPEEPLADITLPESDGEEHKSWATSSITLRSKSRADSQSVPDVGSTGSSPTTHSIMKTKQVKDELDKSIDEETTIEPKTRQAKKKASDISEENKASQDEPKTSKEPKKNLKPKAVVKKRPLGIRKALRSKKVITTAKSKLKNVIKQTATRGRKPVVKTEPDNSQDKEIVPLIPVAEIKKEPVDETTPNSRSSSPKTAGRKQRLTSDKIMLKSVLAESPTSLLGSRTSPYSMRSERSNSPSLVENKNVRRGKPRNVKSKLLNEVVMKEQNKRRRLLSDSKTSDTTDASEDCKKLKRGRSCSREGSEISKCSDITESDVSLSETLTDGDGKELNKKLEKPKTELDLDFENNVQISITEKVPSLIDPKLTDPVTEPSRNTNEKSKKNTSLKRSTSLDSDNNNSNRLKLENLNSSEDKKGKTDKDTLLDARSSILSSMSKTFNTKEVAKNLRKARRGRKVAAAARPRVGLPPASRRASAGQADDADKAETLETLSKEIDDLINNLDQNIDRDHEMAGETADEVQTKSVSKFYGLSKPLGDNNSIITPETPVKDKETPSVTTDSTPSKTDDSENIRLHYEEDSLEKATDANKPEISYKVSSVASIDKLMDRLKVFEEFDKKRQRQESEVRSTDSKTVMVTNDVVLINKSGADIKQLKDVQTVRSPERPIEKENVLSCFENNSAISIVKRDQVRKSIDIDLPNSVTLIKRNSFSSRKESTSSNHSKESDAISIFEKSLGKDVTLTEIRKSVDKSAPTTQVDLHQFATLHPNNPTAGLKGVVLDTSQISITPRVVDSSLRRSRESLSRKTSESAIEPEEKMAVLEKIRSPPPQIKSPPPTPIAVAPPAILVAPAAIVVAPTAIAVAPAPVAVKSAEVKPMETEALAPPLENIKVVPEDISLATEIPKVVSIVPEKLAEITPIVQPEALKPEPEKPEPMAEEIPKVEKVEEKMEIPEETKQEKIEVPEEIKQTETKSETPVETKPPENKLSESAELAKPGKSPGKAGKSARNSTESQPGPSTMLHETPESQKRKENVLRTLGLLTHKAAKEAKIEKLKEKQRIANMNMIKKSKQGSGDYTGTLKTVIKLNRGGADRDKKKYRSSLKMTFQKSKNRAGKPAPELGDAAAEDDAYYTIERKEAYAAAGSEVEAEAAPEPEPKETLNLVIPEKASSFSIHPGRLCQDQCFYCGGKFGLFDTPCHIAQMKSTERQKKVLDNEERLTIDSCLCDACYRHVDRRANCPSYRKRAPKPPGQLPQPQQPEKPPSPSVEPSESDSDAALGARCHADGCGAAAARSIRRKWLIKMRAPVSKLLKLQSDYPGLHTLGLCAAHHALLAPLLACALCRRRLTKHQHVHILHQGHTEINPLLAAAGIPVELADKPVLCKLCRYYTTLLRRPDDNPAHARQYRRRLLQVHNIEVPPESEHEGEEPQLALEGRKKPRSKNKRKPSDPDQPHSDSPDRTASPDKDNTPKPQPDEEDIESLISSNKILVPNAKPSEPTQSDGSDPDAFDNDPVLDKQTELQILLQKQNNPAQFMNQPNLTQKQRNILKVHHLSGIQKPGLQQRINDKNARRLHKLGQMIVKQDKKKDDEVFDPEKSKDVTMKNLSINEECTIESISNKKPADINTLKNKWQQSESFTQVKKNLSELSKKLTVEKDPKQKSEVKYLIRLKGLKRIRLFQSVNYSQAKRK
ncbi:titin-like isoform X2 [Leguminivora glycinivorella]|uniref:titin-like isoform X2 n=1 Tax=Leguminivora glycinivorella TaxID=1035111 RepID=UPI002010497C|nr:titin-like isoform X2 [Leguminivora glycinivorella]